ncbi:MAG: hypothetical protein JSV57_03410 [Candidatus Bathyarchaeota archaeon]|nr:MAG: hypothetical protein JSV57_03410 [Candidatus Bathyarchaeota archaeon]
MEEDCSLCGRVLPYYTLRRCSRCKRLYCGDCITFTWDRGVFRHAVMCLNCARRRVSPRKLAGKYTPLSVYLARRAEFTSIITLSLPKVEEIIGDELPPSAIDSEGWWMNSRSSAQGQTWLDAGWKVDNIDLGERIVTFRKTTGVTTKAPMKKRRGKSEWMKRTPRLTMPRRRRTPSKTRIAKVIARYKNVQRERASMRRYRGRFKPKSAFEKRLYKPDAKPE